MKDHLREILGAEARLAPVPTSHPLYHSFYEFGGGFPGEDRSRSQYMEGNRSWYYPTNNRNDLLALQQEQAAIVSGAASSRKPRYCIRQRGCGGSSWTANWWPC